MSTAINAAFYYVPEGFQTKGKSLMGRQSAGEGFLKGFVRHAGVNNFYCYGAGMAEFQHFQRSILEATGEEKSCSYIPFEEFSRLQEIGCLFYPGPNISNEAWVRRTFGSRAYSLCGVTHTTATERVMDSFGALLIDPVQSWDAIVCTSTVVKKTVERVIYWYGDYLAERLGVRPVMPVQLPVIPLGVDSAQFSPQEKERYRAIWRDKLGIAADGIAVLYMGRLSFSTKAHPLPMFLALEEAARCTGRKVCLILAGWFDPPTNENLWKQDVEKFCKFLKVVFLDGRASDVRTQIWYAADIFTSLSDNIQETFGLTPLEAMAAGLPVVVTDWDGYRETVRHGIDGFRVPVLMPQPGLGEDLAMRFASKADSYGKYCCSISQMTGVDIGACVVAYTKLMEDTELRYKMGSAGKERVRADYEWSIVVKKYQELWAELAERRIRDVENVPLQKGKPSMPLRLDPFRLFQEYPTGHITADSIVALAAGKMKGWSQFISSSVMNSYITTNSKILLSPEEQEIIVERLQKCDSISVADIVQLFPRQREVVVRRSIGWMSKTGIIVIYDQRFRQVKTNKNDLP